MTFDHKNKLYIPLYSMEMQEKMLLARSSEAKKKLLCSEENVIYLALVYYHSIYLSWAHDWK